MKILFAFVVVQLIAGISCSDSTEKKIPSNPQLILELWITILRESLFDDLDREDATVKQAVIDKCTKNGGPTAYDDAEKSLQSLRNSIRAVINDTVNQTPTVNFESWNEQEQIPKLCNTVKTVMNWTKPALDSVRPCLDEGERATGDVMYNMRIAAVDFVCGNNGSNLLSFYRAHGLECSIRNARTKCSLRESYHNNSTVTTYARIAGAPWSYEPSYPSVNDCRKIRRVKTCGVERLSGCEQSEPSNLVYSTFDAIEKAAGCDNILKAQEPSAA
ncbi:27 kDa hemolymph protein-like [Diprion similis]|uniref:27 kDa hemolymph protein-like n=1 Tax=Diprion similis TaxID=362088 RepID=UPI001EF8B0BA|nr:27 kDa hemolymph protein-like [Diprion similis]